MNSACKLSKAELDCKACKIYYVDFLKIRPTWIEIYVLYTFFMAVLKIVQIIAQ